MTKSSPKRPATSVPGIKYLITTASLAVTIAGWSALTHPAPKAAEAAILPPAAVTLVVEQAQPQRQPLIIPTLVPLTTLAAQELPALVPVAQAPDPAQLVSNQTVQVVAPAAPIAAEQAPAAAAPAEPAPVAAAPVEPVAVAAPPAPPVLRQVNAPPRPVVTTTKTS
jgi:ribonuclease E